MNSAGFPSECPPLWTGGPVPGSFHHLPGSGKTGAEGAATRTLNPMVTGTSVLGVTFDGGVMLAADTLGSYGSLARFRSISRVRKVTDACAVAVSGDYADFQFMERLFDNLTIESDSLDDGHGYTPSSVYSWLTRFMYNRRTKINPMWNTVLVGGYHEKKPFLGQINSLGTAFEAPCLATGMGSYIALPLLRDAMITNPNMSKAEAREVLERCMKVLFYRDCRSLNKFELVVIAGDGVEVIGPITIDTSWNIAHYVRGYD